jgi:TfoX/Sxy family transcriptional regulator of competence genes
VAYDRELAKRIRHVLASDPDVTERNMFGGLAFLIRGLMTVVASSKGGLMIRADPSVSTELVDTTPAEFAEMRGRPMQGWLHVDSADTDSDEALTRWIARAVSYTRTLPPKT